MQLLQSVSLDFEINFSDRWTTNKFEWTVWLLTNLSRYSKMQNSNITWLIEISKGKRYHTAQPKNLFKRLVFRINFLIWYLGKITNMTVMVNYITC